MSDGADVNECSAAWRRWLASHPGPNDPRAYSAFDDAYHLGQATRDAELATMRALLVRAMEQIDVDGDFGDADTDRELKVLRAEVTATLEATQ